MIKKNASHRSLLVLVTCVTTICLLVFGMRVPDPSRPHRPKPKPRAYIEQQFKKCQEAVAKKSLDHVQAVLAQDPEPVNRTVYRAEYPSAFNGTAPSPFFPNLSRAPPVLSA